MFCPEAVIKISFSDYTSEPPVNGSPARKLFGKVRFSAENRLDQYSFCIIMIKSTLIKFSSLSERIRNFFKLEEKFKCTQSDFYKISALF